MKDLTIKTLSSASCELSVIIVIFGLSGFLPVWSCVLLFTILGIAMFENVKGAITGIKSGEDVGVETSGTNDFNIYREREWAESGRQDLIDKARAEVKALS